MFDIKNTGSSLVKMIIAIHIKLVFVQNLISWGDLDGYGGMV